MRAIDFPHETTPRNMILRKKFQIFSIFASIHTSISLNQDQGSIFKLWECAQSIPRLEKPKNRRFSHKNPKMFDFRFNTPIPSLNQGQGSVFKVWECAQSILRMKLPPEIWFWGRNFKIFRFSLQYTHLFPWIRVKEVFSRFGNARSRFFAWFYPYIGCFGKKIFSEISP